jgi:MFS superfamily sulfate permease-like transporter
MSVGWLGLDGGLVALEVTGLSTDNPAVQAGIATAMAVIASWVLIPVVSLSLVSGLVLALSTPWGLIRHWWVIVKCVIAIVLTATALLLMLPRLPEIIAGDGDPARMQMLVLRLGALLLLLAATAISVVKPWGKTPRGRRLQRAGGRPEKRAGKQPGKQPCPPVQQK